ncbi:RNA-directed DNA polymerase, eukaryota [Tanacetum coccineum]
MSWATTLGKTSQPNSTMFGNNENAISNKGICNHHTKFQASGSILEVMDELIKVGQTMGYHMDGCMKNIETIIALQETKMNRMDLFSIKALWGNLSVDYAFSPSIGYSGGILCFWDPSLFIKDNSTFSDSFLAISDSWDGECVLLGDFNEVLYEHERHGSLFNSHGANSFNNFITMKGLIDLPLEGYSFWAHKPASKMSKLDRFIISEDLLALFPSISALCLDKHLSDHRPILLLEMNVDYGPTPFCFFILGLPRKLAIRRVLVDGDWIVDPSMVKNKFLKHFANRFAALVTNMVWDCRIKKSPAPDGFTFKFYRKYWNLIDHDVVAAVTSFFSTGSFPPGCNSSFIALIPKTQEAKMVKDFRPISLIGRSILVNGSPTSEFKFFKGLKQGDPLSPFLFILIMGSLHLFFNNVMKAGLYNGIHIDDSLSLSYLFYVDDVIFVGKWNLSNLSTIVNEFFQWCGKCKEEDVFDLLEENLASKKNGGLGVSSFFALNCALLFKWIWRFIANGSSLWSHFITAIYGARGALDDPPSYSRQSPWLDIVSKVRKLSNKGIDLLFLVKKKVGNGEATSFWNDVWLGDSPLKQTSPRSGIEEEQLLLLISNTSSAMLPNISDRWTWRLDSLGVFSVKSAREFIDDYFLSKVDIPTRWVKSIPIKINIFAWRVSLDKLPTRLNLSLRGLDIPSIIFPLCSIVVESTSHLLFSCQLTRQFMLKVARWWELEYQDFLSYEDWLLWFNNLSFQAFQGCLKAIGFGPRFIRWIKVCITEVRFSVIVNGSPTSEANMERGLRQGDPISLFLFILITEVFSKMIKKEINVGVVKGIKIDDSLCVSHIQFADDTFLFAYPSSNEMKGFQDVLELFSWLSGLKVNFAKTAIFGVNLTEEELEMLAHNFNCSIGAPPFEYLGV